MLQIVPTDETTPITDDKTASVPTFEDFWLMYPKRVAKKQARRAWLRLSPKDQVSALVGVAAWLPVWQHQFAQSEDAINYLPHAATYLNNERWEDELPHAFRHKPLAHRLADSSTASDRSTEIPAHVVEMIRKFKERAKR